MLTVIMVAVIAQETDTEDDEQAIITFDYYTIPTPLSETGLNPECMGKDEAFLPFGDTLAVYCDEEFMYIEAFTIAEHEMMVGITAWNEQVPLPHRFTDDNSWQIPLNPELTGESTPTTGQGPIAVAINGVMIFNPTQQDGVYRERSDPYLIGELDACGGHSGRGDDYHYHIAPVCVVEHLADHSDGTLPIAYALDGFPIYGFTNSDGSIPELDECKS
ncbi:MAG: YHYH protein, partial [Chloroflexota bacterium]